MTNTNQPVEVEKGGKSINGIAKSILGYILIFIGFIVLFSSFYSGIILLVFGLLIIPRFSKFIENRFHKTFQRKQKFTVILTLLILVGFFKVVGGISQLETPPESAPVTNTAPVQSKPVVNSTPVSPTVSKAEAESELKKFMDLAKSANLVSSYEFSDKATVVHIDSVWYTQKVDFKKDFIVKVGLLKKAVTGYAHFEVRDAYSDEKVGELTAFTQSIEVYK